MSETAPFRFLTFVEPLRFKNFWKDVIMCTNPKNIKVDTKMFGTHWYKVPCGQCAECKRKYQNDWMIRMSYEATQWNKLCFVTLTYRDEAVPYYSYPDCPDERYLTVHKKHVQDWVKAMRIDLQRKRGKDFKFKFFICAEYGTKGTKRPHYHALFFGLSSRDLSPYLFKWYKKYGIYDAQDVPVLSNKDVNCTARYVAKYCSKGVFENSLVALDVVDPCFRLVSKGLGECYVDKFKFWHRGSDFTGSKYSPPSRSTCLRLFSPDLVDCVIRRSRVTFGDRKYAMPKYYKTKIFYDKLEVPRIDAPDKKPKVVYRASLLSRQVTNTLYKMSCDLRDSALAELQASQGLSYGEADYLYSLQEAHALEHRNRCVLRQQQAFYSKSVF